MHKIDNLDINALSNNDKGLYLKDIKTKGVYIKDELMVLILKLLMLLLMVQIQLIIKDLM